MLLALILTVSVHAQVSPAQIFREGVQAMQAGQFAKAEEDFRTVIALDPKSPAPHINLGVAYMRERRWDEALAELRRAEAMAPHQPGIELNIGLAYYRKNDFASAIQPFTESLHLAPESEQARYLLGLCYFFRGAYQQASGTLEPSWDRESSNMNYLYVLSIAAGKNSNQALEKRAANRMLELGQNSAEFHLYTGKAWLAKGSTDKAIAEFQTAANARPHLPLVHYFLGRAYLEQHDYAKAEAEFLKDVAIEPDFPYSYEDLGRLSAQQNQNAKAEQDFRKAVALDGSLVNSWVGLSKLDRGAGHDIAALEDLDKAVALAPGSASVHYARGQVLARLGQKVKAKQEFVTSANLLKEFNDQMQSGDLSADAQDAVQQ